MIIRDLITGKTTGDLAPGEAVDAIRPWFPVALHGSDIEFDLDDLDDAISTGELTQRAIAARRLQIDIT